MASHVSNSNNPTSSRPWYSRIAPRAASSPTSGSSDADTPPSEDTSPEPSQPVPKPIGPMRRAVNTFIQALRAPRPRTLRRRSARARIGQYSEHAIGGVKEYDMESVIEQAELPVGPNSECTIRLKEAFEGETDEPPVQYISKSYTITPEQNPEDIPALNAELHAYARLAPLQGKCLPRLLGVFRHGDHVGLAMTPPDSALWIEAAPDMPTTLKRHILDAYDRMHALGVLHGDVQLRHMLVNTEGAVSVVDFARSRVFEKRGRRRGESTRAVEERAMMTLERRQVEFLLNWEGARGREERRIAGQGEDPAAPAVPVEDWNNVWVPAAEDRDPRRFVVPGISDADFETAQNRLQMLCAPEDGPGADDAADSSQSPDDDVALPAYNLRKRKRTAKQDTAARPSLGVGARKRAKRSDANPPEGAGPSNADASGAYNPRKSVERTAPERPARRSPRKSRGAQSDAPRPAAPLQNARRRPRSLQREEMPMQPSPLPDRAPPPVKARPKSPIVRDYAYIPHEGPKGYYVPWPAQEQEVARQYDRYREWRYQMMMEAAARGPVDANAMHGSSSARPLAGPSTNAGRGGPSAHGMHGGFVIGAHRGVNANGAPPHARGYTPGRQSWPTAGSNPPVPIGHRQRDTAEARRDWLTLLSRPVRREPTRTSARPVKRESTHWTARPVKRESTSPVRPIKREPTSSPLLPPATAGVLPVHRRLSGRIGLPREDRVRRTEEEEPLFQLLARQSAERRASYERYADEMEEKDVERMLVCPEEEPRAWPVDCVVC